MTRFDDDARRYANDVRVATPAEGSYVVAVHPGAETYAVTATPDCGWVITTSAGARITDFVNADDAIEAAITYATTTHTSGIAA